MMVKDSTQVLSLARLGTSAGGLGSAERGRVAFKYYLPWVCAWLSRN